MSRIVASSTAEFDSYKIKARVYHDPNRISIFHVVVVVYVEGKIHAVKRQTVHGCYWARKTMFQLLQECHGEF